MGIGSEHRRGIGSEDGVGGARGKRCAGRHRWSRRCPRLPWGVAGTLPAKAPLPVKRTQAECVER
eukprot:5595713-Prorocentrum_lima.AAC.1